MMEARTKNYVPLEKLEEALSEFMEKPRNELFSSGPRCASNKETISMEELKSMFG